jgi:hypothetical protein
MRSQRRRIVSAATLTMTLALASSAFAAGAGEIKFDELSQSVSEAAGTAVVLVERSNGESGAVSVHYSAAAGTAVAGVDFQPTQGTLSWGNGDESTKSFAVTILNDTTTDGNKTVLLTLSSPSGGATLDASRSSATLVLGDDDSNGGGGDDSGGGGDDGGGGSGGAGSFKFEDSGFQAFEGAGVAVLVVERSGGESGAVSVHYATSDGTANAGSDYTATSGTLSWAAGQEGGKTINVPLRRDGVEEPAETFQVVLSAPTGGATVSTTRGTALLTLIDADAGAGNPTDDSGQPGQLGFDEASFEAAETGGSALIRVERSHGETGAASVRYSTSDGTAVAGRDYTAVSGVLSWPHGDESVRTFRVPLLVNPAGGGNRIVNLRLSDATGGAIATARSTSQLVILDSNGDRSACVGDDTTLCLEDNRFRVRVQWRTQQGTQGSGHAHALSSTSGAFWFFGDDNLELLFKMVDACGQFDRHWVFYSATTNVGFTVEVTDTASGLVKQYSNAFGQRAESVNDTGTFGSCP